MTLQFSSFMDLIWYVVMVVKWENDLVKKIMMVAWTMWNNRNKFRNGGEQKSGGVVVDMALEYLRDYQECNERQAVTQMKDQPVRPQTR